MNQGPYKHQNLLSVSVPCFTAEWKSPWVVITQGLGFTYESPEIGYGGSCSVAVCPPVLGPALHTVEGQASDAIHRATFIRVEGVQVFPPAGSGFKDDTMRSV